MKGLSKNPKVKCPVCGKVVSTYIAAGDGTGTTIRKHEFQSKRCRGSKMLLQPEELERFKAKEEGK